jgi:hypothetical protein
VAACARSIAPLSRRARHQTGGPRPHSRGSRRPDHLPHQPAGHGHKRARL